jgi:hypothetical protein
MFGGFLFYNLIMDIKIIQTDSFHPDFLMLINLLDEDLAIQNGDKNDFFKPHLDSRSL